MIVLTVLEQETDVVIGGITFTAVERAGHVIRTHPRLIIVDGQRVENTEKVGEFIRLHLVGVVTTYKWSGNLDEYNPDVSEHDPVIEPRWGAE